MKREHPAAAEIASCGHVYSLLARLWLREVDSALIQSLTESELGHAWQSAGGVIPALTDQEDLATEYCRLFIGPRNHVAPFQSVWQTGQLQSDIASSVGQFADLLHYQIPHQYPRTMLDHLGMQMDIMGDALVRRIDDIAQGPDALASEVLREFFSRHLTWPARLLEVGAERACSDFYRSMIDVTANFLLSQRETWQHLAKQDQAAT